MLGSIYFCNFTHNQILDTVFSTEESHCNEFILKGEIESCYDESECIENNLFVRNN